MVSLKLRYHILPTYLPACMINYYYCILKALRTLLRYTVKLLRWDIIDRVGVLTAELEQRLRVNFNGYTTNKNGLSCVYVLTYLRTAREKTPTIPPL